MIEIKRKSDELFRGYVGKVLSIKHFQEYVTYADEFDEKGEFTDFKVIRNLPPKDIILVEDGIKKINELNEIVVTSHNSNMFYDVGSKYYFFGKKIKDNIYETTRASCTVKVQ